MTVTTADTLRSLHGPCKCEIPISVHQPTLTKDGCTVTVDAAQIALDCDECHAFGQNARRPDVIAIRTCDGTDEWVVFEMKTAMRAHAGPQAAAGLSRLGSHPLFPMQLRTAHVIFVVKNRRRGDRTIMRSIGRIRAGGWNVMPQIARSRDRIKCPASPRGT